MTTVALLATHQVDASFQREWELFGVPGGIEFFLFFNFVAIGFLLVSLIKVATELKASTFWRFMVSVTGLLTTIIHAAFLVVGRPEFSQPVSVLILILLLLSSLAELILEFRVRNATEAN